MNQIPIVVSLCCSMAFVFCMPAGAADCLSRIMAPSSRLQNSPPTWNKTDSGPILEGFLDLSDTQGEAQDIAHGADLSHYQNAIDYTELQRCGASFAIVKMDSGFEGHSDKLRAVGIKTLPYHYLGATGLKNPAAYSGASGADLPSAQFDALLEKGRQVGVSQAEGFLSEYNKRIESDRRNFTLSGLTGEVIVIDVEEHFDRSSETQRINFGRVYSRMLSTWIKTVRNSIPDAIIVFYTFPDIYTSYLQYALPEDHAEIHGMPVWLARTRGDGSDFDLQHDKGLQRICLSSSGGNRCILHQYSHRAVFAIRNDNIKPGGIPLHFDVDRLFHSVRIQDGAGLQYVRAAVVN